MKIGPVGFDFVHFLAGLCYIDLPLINLQKKFVILELFFSFFSLNFFRLSSVLLNNLRHFATLNILSFQKANIFPKLFSVL